MIHIKETIGLLYILTFISMGFVFVGGSSIRTEGPESFGPEYAARRKLSLGSGKQSSLRISNIILYVTF
jgi:hypothetical protein